MSHAESELIYALGRLEGKVDTLIQLQRLQEEQIKIHEERIRTLERSRSYAMGIAAAVGAVISTAVTFVTKAFN